MRERGRDGRMERGKDKGMEGGMKGWRDGEGKEEEKDNRHAQPCLGLLGQNLHLMALGKVLRTARAQELLSWRVRNFSLSKQQKSFNK